MTQIDSAFVVNVKREAGALARKSFGVGMLVHYHTKTVERVITITKPEDLADYGFLSNDPLYHSVNAAFGQAVRPKSLKIGRRANAPTFSLTLTIGAPSLVEGSTMRLTVNTTELTRVVPAADTPTAAGAAWVALINGVLGGAYASNALGVITLSMPVGTFCRLRDWSRHFELKSTGSDPGLTADLDAIKAEDSDFTAIELTVMNEAESKSAAAWAEVNEVLFEPTFYDSEIRSSIVTTDAGSDLDALNYKNTCMWYSGTDTSAHIGFALFVWLSAQTLPGGETQAHKQLAGIKADTSKTLFAAERSALRNKSVNFYYQQFADRAVTWEGVATDGEFIDVRRFELWQKYDAQLSLWDAVNSQPDKLPYNEDGRQALISALKASFGRGVKQGGIDNDPGRGFTIIAPEMSEVSSADRAARVFPPMTVRFFKQGAIHATSLTIIVQA
jgi:hypothetical protein